MVKANPNIFRATRIINTRKKVYRYVKIIYIIARKKKKEKISEEKAKMRILLTIQYHQREG